MLDTPISQIQGANSLRDDPKTPTPRRKPHCKSCGSPMLGHKRGHCQTQNKVDSVALKDGTPVNLEPVDLTAAFRSLKLNDQDESVERKARRHSAVVPQRTETLLSLATGVESDLNALMKPGIMTDSVPEEDEGNAKANIQKWLQGLPPSHSPKARRKSAPRSSSTFSSPDAIDLLRDRSNTTRPPRKSLADTAQPLGRTSTSDEREVFFQTLAEKSKKPVASVFTIDMEDIQELAMNAKRLQFYARVIAPKYSNGATGHGWLVLGRDKLSVDDVFREVEKDVKGNTGVVSTAFGGAVGAIVAWVCLAYS